MMTVGGLQVCNVHCSLSWELVHASNCSTSCGPGTRSLSFACNKITANVKKVTLPHITTTRTVLIACCRFRNINQKKCFRTLIG